MLFKITRTLIVLMAVSTFSFVAHADVASCVESSKELGLDSFLGLRNVQRDCTQFVQEDVENEMLSCAKKSMEISLDHDGLRIGAMLEDCSQVIKQPWENAYYECSGKVEKESLFVSSFSVVTRACIEMAAAGLVDPYVSCMASAGDLAKNIGIGYRRVSADCRAHARAQSNVCQ